VWAKARTQPPRAASDDDDEGGRHTGLGENGPQRGTCDAQVQAVHEQQVERDVGAEPNDGSDQRRSRVLQPAENAGHREDDQHRWYADCRHPQIGHGLRQCCGRGAEKCAQRRRVDRDQCAGDDADRDGEPQTIDAGADGEAFRAGAHLSGDDRRGAVGEEDEDVGCGDERGAGHTKSGQLRGAQVADDRGIG
jgi:hypothetical protein